MSRRIGALVALAATVACGPNTPITPSCGAEGQACCTADAACSSGLVCGSDDVCRAEPDAHLALDGSIGPDAPAPPDDAYDSSDAPATFDAGSAPDAFAPPDAHLDATASGCHLATTTPRLDPAAAGLPTDGLVLWLRADVGVRLDGGTNEVCGWENQVGTEVFTPDGAGRPTYVRDWRDGLPAIRAEDGDWLVAPGVLGIAPAAGRTFFAVTEVVDPVAQTVVIYQGLRGSPGLYVGIEHNVGGTAGRLYGIHMPNDVSLDSEFPTTPGAVAVHTLVLDDLVVGSAHTSVAHYYNDGRSSALSQRQGPSTVGDFTSANATWVAWALGSLLESEVLAYARPLDDTERSRVERYLADRHAISAP